MIKSFLIKLFLFSLSIAIADYCWNKFIPEQYFVPNMWAIFIFFASATSLFHVITLRAAKGKPQSFIRYYMGVTALKFFLYIVIIAGYRFIDPSADGQVIPFALGFMAHYFLFTIFEVILLLRQLREK